MSKKKKCKAILPRYELKYWGSRTQINEFFAAMSGLLSADPHGIDNASYTVTSLYFDSKDLCFRNETVEGILPREKIRLRFYGKESNWAFLELKGKSSEGLTVKDRFRISADTLKSIQRGDWEALKRISCGSAQRIYRKARMARAIPVVSVRYDREAYFFKNDPTIRITVDRELELRGLGAVRYSPIPTTRESVLEVKYNDGEMPLSIEKALKGGNLRREGISKYCLSLLS